MPYSARDQKTKNAALRHDASAANRVHLADKLTRRDKAQQPTSAVLPSCALMPPHGNQHLALLLLKHGIGDPTLHLLEALGRHLAAAVFDDFAIEIVVDGVAGFVEELLVEGMREACIEKLVSRVANKSWVKLGWGRATNRMVAPQAVGPCPRDTPCK